MGKYFLIVDNLLTKIFSALAKEEESVIILDDSIDEIEASFIINQLTRDLALANPAISFLLVGNNLNVWVR